MEEEKVNNNTVSAGTHSQPVTTPSIPPVMIATNMNTGNNNGATTTTVPPSAVPAALTTMTIPQAGSGGGSFDLSGKKKRGRPRKYDSDGKLNVKYQSAKSPPGFTFSPISPKRGRGRSTDSTNWQLLSASFGEAFPNSAGGDFTPHVVTVYTGQDVSGKIMSFAQKGPGGICILSANGAISNVAIRQTGSSGGILTYEVELFMPCNREMHKDFDIDLVHGDDVNYLFDALSIFKYIYLYHKFEDFRLLSEGRFEILSLSGSFTVSENSDIRSQSGGLSVSLAGPDGRVIGGTVAGLLTAAGPIQIVMGSFMPNGYNTHKKKQHREHTVASPISFGPDTVTAAGPIYQANPNNIDGENFLMTMSQLPEQSQRESVSVTTSGDTQNIDATPNAATWNGSDEFSDQRISPDINISLPDE